MPTYTVTKYYCPKCRAKFFGTEAACPKCGTSFKLVEAGMRAEKNVRGFIFGAIFALIGVAYNAKVIWGTPTAQWG